MSHTDEPARLGLHGSGANAAAPTESLSVAVPHLDRSYSAFLRDLPGLLAKHPGQWVAYAGDSRLGIHASKRALYRQCIAAGHRDGEFLICGIEPPQEIVLDDLLDV